MVNYHRPFGILLTITIVLAITWVPQRSSSVQIVLRVPRDYPTIQAAIDAAPAGAIIRVQGTYNTYYENIIIKKSITLQAEDKPVLIRGQKRDTPTVTIISDVPIQVALEHFRVFQDANSYGISIKGQARVLLKNQDVYASYDAHGGIWIGGSAHLVLQDAAIAVISILGIGLSVDNSATTRIINTHISGTPAATGIFAKGTAQVNLQNSTVSGYSVGIRVGDSAQVTVQNSVVAGNGQGIKILELKEGYLPIAILEDSQISGNKIGIEVASLSRGQVRLFNSQVSSNQQTGIYLGGKSTAELQHSFVIGNGADSKCEPRYVPPFECIWSGIVVFEKAHLKLFSTEIRGNAYWGLTAALKQCGFVNTDVFLGEVTFGENNIIEGNNRSGMLNGMGNPGNHPFKDLPDGQVCLP